MIIKNIYNKILLKCKKEKGRYSLVGADLRKADLREANLRRTNLWKADLRRTNLWKADLSGADLIGADLREANLCRADLMGADLRKADLSGAIGLIKEIDWLDANLEKTEEGYICYKSFGEYYNSPDNWVIKENSIIEEGILEKDRRNNCAPGINVATKEWCYENCFKQIWKCLLKFEWMDEVCVPYGTDGKFRCSKLQILGKLE
jgi:hypothetical protein